MQAATAVLVRSAVAEDLAALVECDAYAKSHEDRRLALNRWLAESTVCLAEAEGQVLGFAVLEHSLFGQGFVQLLCVRSVSRRHGVALALLANAEQACRTSKLFISANASNDAAQRLFLRAGFIRSGHIDNLNVGESELFYFKALSERA